MDPTRRAVLQLSSGVLLAGIAGCSGTPDSNTGDTDSSPPSTKSPTKNDGEGDAANETNGAQPSTNPDDYRMLDPPSFDDPNELRDGFELYDNLSFRQTPERVLHLDLALPAEEQDAPLVVTAPGSGYGPVDLEGLPSVPAGDWAVATVEYRSRFDAVFPAQVRDLAGALTWLRTTAADPAGIDPDRVVVGGNSSGAHLANLIANAPGLKWFHPVGVDPAVDGIDGVVSWGTRYDFRGTTGDRMKTLFGCRFEECRDTYERASPIAHVDSDVPPPLIWHGGEDPIFDVEQARRYVKALENVGVEPTVIIEEDREHANPSREFWDQRAEYISQRLSL